jgi:peroxiredoxin
MWGDGQGLAAPDQNDPPGTSSLAPTKPRVRPGEMAPDFSLRLLDGATVSLSELRGQVVLVNFWATWCPPCEDELPDLETVWEEYQQRGVILVGIASGDEEVAVKEMVSRFGLGYPVGLDTGERISMAYGITGVPETFVVNSEGLVSSVYVGPVTADRLRGDLEPMLDG